MWYPILGDFEESAQESTVRFSKQPATQSTGSSYSKLHNADSSSQSTEEPADFDTVFSRLPTLSSSSAQRYSMSRTVKAATVSPLSSV
jgi:hypothetical protein